LPNDSDYISIRCRPSFIKALFTAIICCLNRMASSKFSLSKIKVTSKSDVLTIILITFISSIDIGYQPIDVVISFFNYHRAYKKVLDIDILRL
jgi:hypothetical protein